MIYSHEASDDYSPWKRRAINALGGAISLTILGVLVGAGYALWTHPWVIPIVAAPLLVWWLWSSVTHR